MCLNLIIIFTLSRGFLCSNISQNERFYYVFLKYSLNHTYDEYKQIRIDFKNANDSSQNLLSFKARYINNTNVNLLLDEYEDGKVGILPYEVFLHYIAKKISI